MARTVTAKGTVSQGEHPAVGAGDGASARGRTGRPRRAELQACKTPLPVINNVRKYKTTHLASTVILHTQIHTHAVSPPSCCFQIEIKYRRSQSSCFLCTPKTFFQTPPPRGFCPPQNSGQVLLESVKSGFPAPAGRCQGSRRPWGRGARSRRGGSGPRNGGAPLSCCGEGEDEPLGL